MHLTVSATRRLIRHAVAWGIALSLTMPAAAAETLQTQSGPGRVERMAGDLFVPWAMDFLPGGAFLVTLRDGELLHFSADGTRQQVQGTPRVADEGQGGLLDVMVPNDFERTREVYLSFAKPQGRSAGTAVGVGQLSQDGASLIGFRTLFEMEPGSKGGRHFGSRITEGRDGFLYITIGERGDRPSAQDLSRENGSIVRIARDGRVPADNPFVGRAGAQPEIWSYGHRNPQGADLDLSGRLWVAEHGARGGDEVNRIEKGANYGWPVISYGTHYSGAKIGEGTAKAGMKQPAFYWDPSIAPSGLMVYSGKLWPDWRGHFFVGSLKFDMISRLSPGKTLREVERISGPMTSRIRDIDEAPDGAIWFMSVGEGAIYRLTPGQ